ncbi:hypothetical protein KQ304_06960 [Synechococcus sp. CS-1329]|uniref:tubulin-like doman-containing protein n=1 Tax=Synechococcus sp. CS-1329 TaxID=2847975 RepID=UPI00223B55AE|nr:tubulin-like doman-containing protein [Synechococcus sp. CS-1329]MCT0218737.1 hypothetical protein [Synechococcus sp. CS-1329]
MSVFAIGVGGTGAKCLEALTHLHTCGLLEQGGTSVRLGTFLVEPDQQSTLLARAETAIDRYQKMRRLLGSKADHFARGELRHYGTWSPLSNSSGAISLDQVFPKAILRTRASGLAALFDCLFPPEEQAADLEVGFRGRPPIGSAVMSRVSLTAEAKTGQWQQMLSDIETASGGGETPVIHLFGSVFGGTGASGVPTLGQMLKSWLKEQGLNKVKVNASLLLPYFDFEGQAREDTGVHAEARNFQLNTDAALQYLRSSGTSCFDQVYLVGSDIKARYDFSIGGRSQANGAHLVELLASLGMRHGLKADSSSHYAHVLSRAVENKISWGDIPDSEVVGEGMARAARFGVAWLNNISLELDAAQSVPMPTFLSGAPWAHQFFQPSGQASGTQAGRPSIRSSEELSLKTAIDAYVETLLQWLQQFSSNTGTGFSQELFTPELLERNSNYENALGRVVRGSARPSRDEQDDTVEAIKVLMDALSHKKISHNGMAGLADTLWSLSYCDTGL